MRKQTDPKISLQPDGIADDSRDLPDPHRAARRVRAYITGAGDGLYDVSNPGDGPRPLYARDLEALVRAAESAHGQLPQRDGCPHCGRTSHGFACEGQLRAGGFYAEGS